MDFSVATVTLKSLSPYSQSLKHDEPFLKGERPDAHEKRTWQSKAHFHKDNDTLVIPSAAMHQALSAAAQYSKIQIPGQGKATWTAKFKSGISIVENIDTGIKRADVTYVDLWVDSKGKTGTMAGTRVLRRFPQIPEWSATFDIWVLDPIITDDVLQEMIRTAGMFVGIGRWRPIMQGGMNGRFKCVEFIWQDNRTLEI